MKNYKEFINEGVRDKMLPKEGALDKLYLLVEELIPMLLEDGYFDSYEDAKKFLTSDDIIDNLGRMKGFELNNDEIYLEITQFYLDEYLYNNKLPLKFAFDKNHKDDISIVGSDAYNKIHKLFYYEDDDSKKTRSKRRGIVMNEGVRDLMTPKSKEDILKSLSHLSPDEKIETIINSDQKELFTDEELEKIFKELEPIQKIKKGLYFDLDWLTEMGIEESIEQDLEPEEILEASFKFNYIKGIKHILDNYKLYGKDTKFIVSCYMPDMNKKEDIKYLMNQPQIVKFLNPEQKYVIEKYRLGMHKNEVRDYEQKIIDILETLEYVPSKEDPNIMIGRVGDGVYLNRKDGQDNFIEGVYFNYNKKTNKLVYHLDRLARPLQKNPGDSGSSGIYDFGRRYDDMIISGLISNFYNIPIDNDVDSSRNDKYSFKEI